MTNLETVPCALGDNAAHIDLEQRRVTLYSGREMPVVRIWDADGEEIEDCELNLHDDIMVVYGPDNNGTLFVHPMRRGDRDVLQ